MITVTLKAAGKIRETLQKHHVTGGLRLGVVGGDALSLKTPAGEFRWTTAQLHDSWWNSLARIMA